MARTEVYNCNSGLVFWATGCHETQVNRFGVCINVKKDAFVAAQMTVMRVKHSVVSVILSVCVCVFVCLHNKTKTTETKIPKLGTGIIHHKSLSISYY